MKEGILEKLDNCVASTITLLERRVKVKLKFKIEEERGFSCLTGTLVNRVMPVKQKEGEEIEMLELNKNFEWEFSDASNVVTEGLSQEDCVEIIEYAVNKYNASIAS